MFRFPIIALALTLSGCATIPDWRSNSLLQANPEFRIANVPYVPQDPYQCGPSTMSMVLQHQGIDIPSDVLEREIYSPARQGSLQVSLIGAARRHGRLPVVIKGLDDLITEIQAEHPVIVLQNLGLSWYPRWHYALVTGYDSRSGIVYMHSGPIENHTTAFSTFLRTWERGGYWGLVVSDPSDLPASVDEKTLLRAILALEPTGKTGAAETAYQAFIQRWPQSARGYIALANLYYNARRLDEAESVLRSGAETSAPESDQRGDLHNNLAQVFLETHQLDEALIHARTAIHIGGEHIDIYRQTLNAIEQAQRNNE